MSMLLKGSKVVLKPMSKEDIPLFFKWATESDATKFWYGEIYGTKIPSFKEFVKDWKPHYFEHGNPALGKCFFIIVDENPIGQINYNNIENGRVEIDILIADAENWGKGYGSDAIRTLISYLFEKLKVKEVWVAAIKKNPRAVSAYKKSGLKTIEPWEELKQDPEWKNKKLDDYVFLSILRN